MEVLRNSKGITLIALIITIIVLMILAGISITEGAHLIEKAKAESLLTNMITLKAKCKIYAEEVNSKVWDLQGDEKATKREELFQNEYYMTKENIIESNIENDIDSLVKEENYEVYLISNETLEKMGLSGIEDIENYLVVYNLADYTKLDIVNKAGIEYDGNIYYTLSTAQSKIGE